MHDNGKLSRNGDRCTPEAQPLTQLQPPPMPPFIVTFDLVKKESSPDYRPLIRDLLKRGAHEYQPLCWRINVANTAAEVYEYFRQFLHADDRLMVSELTNNYKLDRNFEGANDWIENNPPVR